MHYFFFLYLFRNDRPKKTQTFYRTVQCIRCNGWTKFQVQLRFHQREFRFSINFVIFILTVALIGYSKHKITKSINKSCWKVFRRIVWTARSVECNWSSAAVQNFYSVEIGGKSGLTSGYWLLQNWFICIPHCCCRCSHKIDFKSNFQVLLTIQLTTH